mgnify:CR=1 FL=1
MNPNYLDFEQPIADLEAKIQELRKASDGPAVNIDAELATLRDKLRKRTAHIFRDLTPWQVSQLARHPQRPYTLDYIKAFCGIVGGLGRIDGRSVMIIGHQKGRDTKTKVRRNFGMPRPEGYRKALRLMKMAERFGLPLLTFIDTPGAYPGIGAEERGQAEAIARSTETCLNLRVPLVSLVIGEGGSGGAIALAAADRILMLEHSIYSVISPEGGASILWRDAAQAPQAADAFKLTAEDLLRLNLVDAVVPEPLGGAHRDPAKAVADVGQKVWEVLQPLLQLDGVTLKSRRREKFLEMGRHGAA